MRILRHGLERVNNVLRNRIVLGEDGAKLFALVISGALARNQQPEGFFRRDVGELEDRRVADAQAFVGRYA